MAVFDPSIGRGSGRRFRPRCSRPTPLSLRPNTDEERHCYWSDGRSGIPCSDDQFCPCSADVPCWRKWWDLLPRRFQLQGQRVLPCHQTRAAVLPCWWQWRHLLPSRFQLCGVWLLQDALTLPIHQGLILQGEHLTKRCSQWVVSQEVKRGWCPEGG